jgi:hypothetical protein
MVNASDRKVLFRVLEILATGDDIAADGGRLA